MTLTRIALAGEGGQGVQVTGEILAEAAFRSGLNAIYIPNFGVEQRGGVSIAFVQISPGPIGAPKFKHADILVALSKRAMKRTLTYIKPETLYIFDSSAVKPPEIANRAVGIQGWDTVAPEAFSLMVGLEEDTPPSPPSLPQKVLGIPAAEMAKALISRVFNIIILGCIVAVTELLDADLVRDALEVKLAGKFTADPKLKELNMTAFAQGLAYGQSQLSKEGAKT